MKSFLSRHRTICEVLYEIKENTKDQMIKSLVDEALDYARRMSMRLQEYKAKEEQK